MVAASVPSQPPPPPDPRFPNLRADVVAGYLNAPDTMVAEVIDGELSVMPRPRPRHTHAASRFMRRLGVFTPIFRCARGRAATSFLFM